MTCKKTKEQNNEKREFWLGLHVGTHLVRLHRLEHAEAADVDHANLMALASSWVEVHQRHDVLRVLGIGPVSSNVHNLKEKSIKKRFCDDLSQHAYLIDEPETRRVDVQADVDEISFHAGSLVLDCHLLNLGDLLLCKMF